MPWNSRSALSLLIVLFAALSMSAQEGLTPVYRKKFSMGTVFEIVAYDVSATRASSAIADALAGVDRLDYLLSNYRSDSAVSRLNRSGHFHAESVPPDLYRVIEESLQYAKLSAGKFDITVGPLSGYWKAVMRGERAPSNEQVRVLESCIGYEKIVLTEPNQVEFRSPCLEIDLGAIGKGYAVDRAVEILRAHGISRALVNAGGSTLYGLGSPPGHSGWRICLRDPSGRVRPEITLLGNSVSTSEQTSASLLGNPIAGHVIDPYSGLPLETTVAVTAVAKTATASDALSTALLLLGPDRGRELIPSIAGSAAIWISPEGHTSLASSGPRFTFQAEHGDRVRRHAAGGRTARSSQ